MDFVTGFACNVTAVCANALPFNDAPVKSAEIIDAVKKKSPHALVIYLTSIKPFDPTKEELAMGWVPKMEPPVWGYVQKPVRRQELLDKISEALRTKNIFSEKK